MLKNKVHGPRVGQSKASQGFTKSECGDNSTRRGSNSKVSPT